MILLTFWVEFKDFGKMQQSQSPKKYSQTLLKRQIRLQAAVLWGALIHAIRNSVRLNVTEMSWSHLETLENLTYHDEDNNYEY